MKGRKKGIYLGAIVLCLLLIIPTVNVLGTIQDSSKKTVLVIEKNSTPLHDELHESTTQKTIHFNNVQNTGRLDTDIQVTTAMETENNPAIGVVPTGELLVSYTKVIESSENNVIWSYSLDKGQTWNAGQYPLIEGKESHPAIDYWGTGKKCVGTMMGDPYINDGANYHVFYCTDITDTETYSYKSVNWAQSYPYSDRRIPDIGGYDGNGISWWYGIVACVGTRGSPGSVDMPIFNYANYVTEGNHWSSYFSAYPGCENAAIEIDQTNGLFYAVFDNYNSIEDDWDLLLIRGNATNDGSDKIRYISQGFITDVQNTTYPAVDVHDNKVIIVAQSDEAGSQDIVCYYSSDAGVTWFKSFVTDGLNDELYPKIVTFGDKAICTFIMDGDLYYAKTENIGETWSTPEKINDETGLVQSEYRNTDITTDGTVVWTDMRNGNADVYLDRVSIGIPTLELGSFTAAGIGKVSIPVKNIGSANATNVSVLITVTGGLLKRVNKTKTAVIPTLAINQEINVTTDGFIFGFGKITLYATASCSEAVPPSVTKTATAKLIIVFIRNIT
ncbi:hypothetical protein AYK25_01320 [Thermoplasmatales archaeon SM1-50]|nr:MAG: hypothetical protein AYK25_01320 [Thermoplasmatales archaeon SM1-50]